MIIEQRMSDQNTIKRKDDFLRIELADKLKVESHSLKALTKEHIDQSDALQKMTLAYQLADRESEVANKTLESARKELANKLKNLREAKKENEAS